MAQANRNFLESHFMLDDICGVKRTSESATVAEEGRLGELLGVFKIDIFDPRSVLLARAVVKESLRPKLLHNVILPSVRSGWATVHL